MKPPEIFTLICQECGRVIPLDRPVWGQEYPNQPGSPSVPFCSESHRARYARDFEAERTKFLKKLGMG